MVNSSIEKRELPPHRHPPEVVTAKRSKRRTGIAVVNVQLSLNIQQWTKLCFSMAGEEYERDRIVK